jgi:hypothetical protein
MPIAAPPSASSLSDGRMRLLGAIAQATDLAVQIERGQAQMPLRDHFEAISTSLDSAPFALTLLGLDAASRAAALGWLCGEDFHILSIEVPGAAGLVEVQLAERGYVLVKSGRRQEFDRLEPFLEAVRAADLVRQGDADAWLEPMHLEVAAPAGVQGLRLLMPESPAAVAESPALRARLRSESNFLVVSGPIDHALDAATAVAVRELAADAMVAWVLTTGSAPSPDDLLRGWPALLGGRCVPPVHLGLDGGPPPVSEFLREDRSGVRGGLFMCQHARRFDTALDMLDERIRQDLRQHEARRKMLMRRSAVLGEPGQDRAVREASEAIRPALDDGLGRLQAQLAESHRERLLPGSVPNNKINNLLEDVTADDLARDASGRVIQLAVASGFRDKVRRLVSDLIRSGLRADLEALNSGLEALGRDVATRLAAVGGDDLRIAPPQTLDEANLWESIRKTIQLDSRYHGELITRGKLETTFELAMHARRPIFLIMMTAPILFPFLPNPRVQLAPLMLPLLIGGVAWAIHSFRAEHQEKIEREVARLRDTLGAEIRGLYGQALRDANDRAAQHLREVAKKLAREIEERLKACAAELASRTARERIELQDKLKAVDSRLRDLGGLIQQVGRARQASAEARQALERATRDALRDVQQTARVI